MDLQVFEKAFTPKNLGFGGVALGLFLILDGGVGLATAQRYANWKTVPGVVEASDVSSRLVRETKDGKTRKRRRYAVKIRYGYDVDGKHYTSDSIGARTFNLSGRMFQSRFGSRSSADRIAERYPEGGAVNVHYDPSNPAEAVLETDTGFGKGGMLVGLLIALAGGAFVFSARAS